MQENNYLQKHFSLVYCCLFALGLFFSFWYATHQIVDGDITQMLDKGYHGFYTGVWSSYGNAASVVGNVPGSLLAFVVGFPLFIVDSPWAPMGFLILLHALSFFLLDNIVKHLFGKQMQLVFLLLYWLNPWFLFENILYNPSYLFFFASLHLWSAFKLREKSSFIYSFLHLLSIGMAMQVHYSWIILAVMSSFLLYKRVVQVNWYGVITAFVLIATSLYPYIQEFMHNEAIRSNEGNKDGERYIGWGGLHVYPVIKAFFYWLRYGSFVFTNKLITGAHFDWLTASLLTQQFLQYSYQAILFSFGALTLWVSFLANKYFYQQVKGKILHRYTRDATTYEWIYTYILGTLLGILVSAILSPIVFNYWHLLIIFPFALFPLLLFLHNKHINKVKKYFFYILLYIIFVNSVASIDSKKFSLESNYAHQVEAYLKKGLNK